MTALLATLVLGLAPAPADVRAAEEAYAAGRWAEAYEAFEQALADPVLERGALLYDLGNCAFRLGRHAEAALLYRRAHLRLPRDPEVAFNLRLAEEELGVARAADRSLLGELAALGPRALLVAALALQVAGLAGLVLLGRWPSARTASGVALLLGLAAAARLVQLQWFPAPPVGVVLAPDVRVRPEPHTSFAPSFELAAGEVVQVEESSDRWVRVTHRRGSGWTELAGVGRVD